MNHAVPCVGAAALKSAQVEVHHRAEKPAQWRAQDLKRLNLRGKSQEKILIVEDDYNFGSILKDYLTLNSYKVTGNCG